VRAGRKQGQEQDGGRSASTRKGGKGEGTPVTCTRRESSFLLGGKALLHRSRLVVLLGPSSCGAAGSEPSLPVQLRGILAWRSLLERRACEKAAYLWAAERIVRTPLVAWRGWAAAKGAHEVMRRRAVRRRYLSLLRRALLAWGAVLLPPPDRQDLWAAVRHVAGLQVLEAALAVWAEEFVPHCRSERLAASQAALHWRLRLLRCSAWAWGREAERLAGKRAALLAAAEHLRSHALQKSVLSWFCWAADKVQRRERRMARLSEAWRVLSTSATRRALQTWVEHTRQEAIVRLKCARAAAWFSRRLCTAAWKAWSLHVVVRRWKASRAQQAAAFQGQRRLRRALAFWMEFNSMASETRHLRTAAVRRWCSALLGRAMRSWLLYQQHRLAKRERMASALATYTQRLQREGTVQWLRVAEWRREHRIHSAMALQMKEMRTALALAEPFARRWLHAVRQRNAKRRGISGLHVRFDNAAWQSAMYQRRLSAVPLASPPSAASARTSQGGAFGREERPWHASACAAAPSPLCSTERPRWQSPAAGGAAATVASALPAWRSSSAMAAAEALCGAGQGRGSSASASLWGGAAARARPRIPSVLFEDGDEPFEAAAALNGSAMSAGQQPKPALPPTAAMPDSFTVDARLTLQRVVEAAAADPSGLTLGKQPSAFAVAHEIACMEAVIREFQALKNQAAAASARAQQASGTAPSLKREAQDLQLEIERRKPHVRQVALRIKELKQAGARPGAPIVRGGGGGLHAASPELK